MSILSKEHLQVWNHLSLRAQKVFMWITVKRHR